MKKAILLFIIVAAGSGFFLFFISRNDVRLSNLIQTMGVAGEIKKPIDPNADLPPQKPLSVGKEALKVIKAIYATGWSAGSDKVLNRFIDLIKVTELNAIVIDIKDYSGEVSYRTNLEKVEKYGKNRDLKILKPNAMIKKLHDAGIYIIARQTVFQDPILARARPDLALTSISTGKQWEDLKGIMWIDPASQEAWDYNIEIAKDALARGFDEINFDYIRFSSDGDLKDIKYPFWDGKILKKKVMHSFFKYLRESLGKARLSADLFGYTTIHTDDLGIGQNLDDAFPYFNAIAPMVYPSHYNKGFLGFSNPAVHPYEVVYNSMLLAQKRLNNFNNSTTTEKAVTSEFRPWLQDFNLGANYTAEMVRSEINAVYNSATGTPIGWMLWNPSNNYTPAALLGAELTSQ